LSFGIGYETNIAGIIGGMMLPAFVRILSELSADEAMILDYIYIHRKKVGGIIDTVSNPGVDKEKNMDPITAALVAALAAGATQLGKSAVVDSYNGVKTLIKKKFAKTDLPAAIESLEKKPESKSRQGMVQEEVESINADKDPEILSTIQALVDAVMNTPQGPEVIRKYNLNIRGSDVGVIGDKADIKGGIHFGKK
jgi:hypothetical protein